MGNNARVKVAFSIPSLAAGAVLRGKRGAVQVAPNGELSPYTAPLNPWSASGGQQQASPELRPETAPLGAPGFGPTALR